MLGTTINHIQRAKNIFLIFSLLCITFYSIQLFAEEIIDDNEKPPISIVVTSGNAPFSFVLPDSSLTGLYVEFWKLWSSTNNVPVKFIVSDFEEGISIVKNKKAIHAGLFVNQERAQWADFSFPIHQVETGILYGRNYSDKNILLSLQQGIIVSAYSGSFQASYIKSNHPQVDFLPYQEDDLVFDQLFNEEIQAIVAEVPYLKSQLASRGLTGVLTLSDEILLRNKVHAVIAKGQPELLKTINEGIENIPIKSLIDLEKKWLPTIEPFFKEHSALDFLTLSEKKWIMNHTDFSLGVDSTWYPFDFSDKNGEFTGIASDYVEYVSHVLNINMTPVKGSSWLESLNKTKIGKVDMMAAAVSTEIRKKSMYFTEPYFSENLVIVTHRNSFYANDMTSLFGKTLGVIEGFSINDWIKEEFPLIKYKYVKSVVDGLEKVDTGEIDSFVGGLSVINYEIEKRDLRNIQIAAFLPYKFEISFAVRKGLEPLVPILNKALAKMSEKQKTIIANNWLAVHVENGTKLKVILLWGLPIFTILSLIIIIITRLNRRLKNEVETRKKAEKGLEYLAHHDELTGLKNWRMFEKLCDQKLNSAEAQGNKQVFLFLDIDGFKEVNDTYGHKTGDQLMIAIAKRLNNCLEANHQIARIGGDEFIIYLGKESDKTTTQNRIVHILQSLSTSYKLEGNLVNITASIGVSYYPANGTDTETLIKNADTAMYAAKTSGKNTYKYYREL